MVANTSWVVNVFTQTWVLAGTVDTFDAADFATDLALALDLPPPMVAVRVVASSVTVHATILTLPFRNSTAAVGAALHRFASFPSAAEAALGITVESVSDPTVRQLNASQGGGLLLNITELALQETLETEIGGAFVATEEAAWAGAADGANGAAIAFLLLITILFVGGCAFYVLQQRRKQSLNRLLHTEATSMKPSGEDADASKGEATASASGGDDGVRPDVKALLAKEVASGADGDDGVRPDETTLGKDRKEEEQEEWVDV